MIGMCPVGLERRLVLDLNRRNTSPEAWSAIRDYVEPMRHKFDPMDLGDMMYLAEEGSSDSGSMRWDAPKAKATKHERRTQATTEMALGKESANDKWERFGAARYGLLLP